MGDAIKVAEREENATHDYRADNFCRSSIDTGTGQVLGSARLGSAAPPGH